MEETADFAAYSHLADELIGKVTKEQVGDLARLLALNIGYYHEKYGDVPQELLLGMVRAETLDDESKRLLLHGGLLYVPVEDMGFHEIFRRIDVPAAPAP